MKPTILLLPEYVNLAEIVWVKLPPELVGRIILRDGVISDALLEKIYVN